MPSTSNCLTNHYSHMSLFYLSNMPHFIYFGICTYHLYWDITSLLYQPHKTMDTPLFGYIYTQQFHSPCKIFCHHISFSIVTFISQFYYIKDEYSKLSYWILHIIDNMKPISIILFMSNYYHQNKLYTWGF